MQGYQAGIQSFTSTDSVVFGISTDPIDTNTKFAESLNVEFAILSDEGGAVSKKYDVLNERMMSNPHDLRHRQGREDQACRERLGRDRSRRRRGRLQQALAGA